MASGQSSNSEWRRSTFSDATNCVEIAGAGRDVTVRNSNHPDAGTLTLSRPDLGEWLTGIKGGELDDLT
jgi:hypothetical protein